MIVTGPTGSGKTTLLYSLLAQIHTVTKNIVTVEDPIEYQVPGVNQVQVDEKGKKTFAAVLRAMLRQDPDVIMIGEIRDKETAQIAFRASITGHLVLSTVHTNDAPAPSRASSLPGAPLHGGFEPHRRRLDAARPDPLPEVQGRVRPVRGGAPVPRALRERRPEIVLYRPVGCEHCNETGFRGRTGIYEILEMKETLRRLVTSGAPETMIRSAAIEGAWCRSGRTACRRPRGGDDARGGAARPALRGGGPGLDRAATPPSHRIFLSVPTAARVRARLRALPARVDARVGVRTRRLRSAGLASRPARTEPVGLPDAIDPPRFAP